MKKVFVDTNVWLRYFMKDNDKQFTETKTFFSNIEEGTYKPYTSSIVLMEIFFVLKSLYKKNNTQILEVFALIQSLRNITIIEKTDWQYAIKSLKETRVKFSDCLIASQIAEGMTLVSYDQEFKKFKSIQTQTPGEMY